MFVLRDSNKFLVMSVLWDDKKVFGNARKRFLFAVALFALSHLVFRDFDSMKYLWRAKRPGAFGYR